MRLDITPEIIERFCLALRDKLRDKGSKFGKAYLKLLIEEIRVEGRQIRITGRNAHLTEMLQKTKVDLREGVPTFGINWLPESDVSGNWEEGLDV